MTVAVLGLDAADYELVKKWNCENLLLSEHRSLKTDSFSLDVPATLEVWPSIATGLHPTEHGVTVNPSERKSRSLIRRLLSKLIDYLPDVIQSNILKIKSNVVESSFPVTDHQHVFDAGTVSNWPGITPCHDWDRDLAWFNQVKNGEITEKEFLRRELGNAGKGLGWLRSQALADVPITGCHIHILDMMGHLHGSHPDSLKIAYNYVNKLVGEIRSNIETLVILSDHGMQCSALGDSEPGVHSFRSFISTNHDGPLPESIYDVRNYLTNQIEPEDRAESVTNIDAPTEHLEDLGYLE